MEHRRIEEEQLVDRYLMGQLAPEEALRFEEHFVHCQQCLDELELGERLQRGIRRAALQDATRFAVGARAGFLAGLVRMAGPWRLGLVASFLLALALPIGFGWRELRRAEHELDGARATIDQLRRQQSAGATPSGGGAPEPQTNTVLLSLGPERGVDLAGGEPSYVVRLSDRPEWIVLSLELDVVELASYEVILSRASEDIWSGNGLTANNLDSLVISLHSSWLEPGDYSARVVAAGADGGERDVARYAFRVLPAEG